MLEAVLASRGVRIRLATKADVTAVLVEVAHVRTEVVGVKTDVVWIRRLLWIVLSLCITIIAGVVVLLFRLFAGGVP